MATATRNAIITNTCNYTQARAPQKLSHRLVAPGHVQGVLVQLVPHVDWLAVSLQQYRRLSDRRRPRRSMQCRRALRGRHLQNGYCYCFFYYVCYYLAYESTPAGPTVTATATATASATT